MKKIFLDFETKSTADLNKVGAWKYALHPTTDIICFAAAEQGGPVKVYTPEEFKKGGYFGKPDEVRFVCHSAVFEYAIFNCILGPRYGWGTYPDPRNWDCTLSRAAMCGIPLSLEKLALALELPFKKDMSGRRALMKICKPVGTDALGDPIWNDSPALYQKVYDYCGRDVETEMAADARLPELPPDERKIWELDMLINKRGVHVDVKAAQAAADLAERLTTDLNERLVELTNGAVDSASRVAAIRRWLHGAGLKYVNTLNKEAVTAILDNPEIPADVREVLSIRRQVGKSSTAKFTATINAADEQDDRVRGVLQYHAAATGRWGGRLIQPQNYPKGLPPREQETAISLLERPEVFRLMYGSEGMQTLSDILRGTINAAGGNKLVVADFAAIEARVVLWLAGDTTALEKIRKGENLYVDMGRYIYGRQDITKHGTPKEYAVGKMAVLGCGYGMGKDRFHVQCGASGISITVDAAAQAVRAYREKYRSVVNMWYGVERAALSATKSPGSVHKACGDRVLFALDQKREFLGCRLPSGRWLRYYRPSAKVVDGPLGEKEEIHYWAAGISGALEEQKTYGGSLVENITQAVARDLMAHAMITVEEAGYPVVLSVHDELVAEVSENFGNPKEFEQLMCALPEWAVGLPVAAEGWEGKRYRK